MAFHYLVDGYNMIYAWPEIPPGVWDLKRKFLLRFLQTQKPQKNNRVTVIFDSREGSGTRQSEGGIEVVFTAGETADDWISRKVREAGNPRILIVVSNDKGIRAQIRGTGAKFMSADEFIAGARRPAVKHADPAPPTADDITEELKKKWL